MEFVVLPHIQCWICFAGGAMTTAVGPAQEQLDPFQENVAMEINEHTWEDHINHHFFRLTGSSIRFFQQPFTILKYSWHSLIAWFRFGLPLVWRFIEHVHPEKFAGIRLNHFLISGPRSKNWQQFQGNGNERRKKKDFSNPVSRRVYSMQLSEKNVE
jgi:hypothetical protein